MSQPTLRTVARSLAIVGALASFSLAQTSKPATTEPTLLPSGTTAMDALKQSPRHGEWADIEMEGGKKLHTWVVYPERSDKAPVVLVIHEIFGMSDWVRATADALAAQGFIAVAPDFLSGMGPNGGNTESFKDDDVRAAIMKLSGQEVAAKLEAARKYAAKLPSAGPKVGVVGFCWGGGMVWQYALRNPELGAAVVFYGTGPQQPDEYKSVMAPILGHYGGDDARVTSTVEASRLAMTNANKSYEPIVHAGAGHGFMRQQDGKDGKNLEAARKAWTRTIAFLKEKLEG